MLDLEQLQLSINEAMRSRDAAKLSTLRLIKVSLQNEAISLGHPLDEQDIQIVLRRELKKRDESIVAFRAAGRQAMLDIETAEAELLRSYLPKPVSDEEIQQAASTLISSGIVQAGPLTGILIKQFKGQADGVAVSRIVRDLLA